MRAFLALAAILASTGALAQDHHPYAGMEQRAIESLSGEPRQVASLPTVNLFSSESALTATR